MSTHGAAWSVTIARVRIGQGQIGPFGWNSMKVVDPAGRLLHPQASGAWQSKNWTVDPAAGVTSMPQYAAPGLYPTSSTVNVVLTRSGLVLNVSLRIVLTWGNANDGVAAARTARTTKPAECNFTRTPPGGDLAISRARRSYAARVEASTSVRRGGRTVKLAAAPESCYQRPHVRAREGPARRPAPPDRPLRRDRDHGRQHHRFGDLPLAALGRAPARHGAGGARGVD